jgi:hypothetical protein
VNAPCKDIADLLVTAGVGTRTITADWRITQGMTMEATPDRTIHVKDAGGFAPDPKWQHDRPTVQVMIRGKPGSAEYPITQAKAQAVKDALLGRPAVTIGDTHYIGIWMIGDITPVGVDANQRPLFVCNFRLERKGLGGYRSG